LVFFNAHQTTSTSQEQDRQQNVLAFTDVAGENVRLLKARRDQRELNPMGELNGCGLNRAAALTAATLQCAVCHGDGLLFVEYWPQRLP
jgi:hypothetical protein